jgi:enoyl-CoA hydratase/carnithine racemase
MNAWTNTMDNEIKDAIGRACADRSVVGIIITGAGRAFCAGADMKTLSALTEGAPAAVVSSVSSSKLIMKNASLEAQAHKSAAQKNANDPTEEFSLLGPKG